MEPHALTAANLIDAIITHQINQSNDGSGHPPSAAPVNNQPHVQPQRAGDKLFQVSHKIVLDFFDLIGRKLLKI